MMLSDALILHVSQLQTQQVTHRILNTGLLHFLLIL